MVAILGIGFCGVTVNGLDGLSIEVVEHTPNLINPDPSAGGVRLDADNVCEDAGISLKVFDVGSMGPHLDFCFSEVYISNDKLRRTDPDQRVSLSTSVISAYAH